MMVMVVMRGLANDMIVCIVVGGLVSLNTKPIYKVLIKLIFIYMKKEMQKIGERRDE